MVHAGGLAFALALLRDVCSERDDRQVVREHTALLELADLFRRLEAIED